MDNENGPSSRHDNERSEPQLRLGHSNSGQDIQRCVKPSPIIHIIPHASINTSLGSRAAEHADGVLLPLADTLSAQMQLLSREFEWPSEASVTLHIPLSGSQNWANEKDSLAPRITETVWSSLSSHWQDRGFGHVTGYPIVATLQVRLQGKPSSPRSSELSNPVQDHLHPTSSTPLWSCTAVSSSPYADTDSTSVLTSAAPPQHQARGKRPLSLLTRQERQGLGKVSVGYVHTSGFTFGSRDGDTARRADLRSPTPCEERRRSVQGLSWGSSSDANGRDSGFPSSTRSRDSSEASRPLSGPATRAAVEGNAAMCAAPDSFPDHERDDVHPRALVSQPVEIIPVETIPQRLPTSALDRGPDHWLLSGYAEQALYPRIVIYPPVYPHFELYSRIPSSTIQQPSGPAALEPKNNFTGESGSQWESGTLPASPCSPLSPTWPTPTPTQLMFDLYADQEDDLPMVTPRGYLDSLHMLPGTLDRRQNDALEPPCSSNSYQLVRQDGTLPLNVTSIFTTLGTAISEDEGASSATSHLRLDWPMDATEDSGMDGDPVTGDQDSPLDTNETYDDVYGGNYCINTADRASSDEEDTGDQVLLGWSLDASGFEGGDQSCMTFDHLDLVGPVYQRERQEEGTEHCS